MIFIDLDLTDYLFAVNLFLFLVTSKKGEKFKIKRKQETPNSNLYKQEFQAVSLGIQKFFVGITVYRIHLKNTSVR